MSDNDDFWLAPEDLIEINKLVGGDGAGVTNYEGICSNAERPMTDVKWIPIASAIRIRQADSLWRSTEDNHTWHQREDAKISFRADPWTAALPETD